MQRVFPDNSEIKLEIKTTKGTFPNTWKVNKNSSKYFRKSNRVSSGKEKKYIELNENENTMYQNWDVLK